MENTLEKIQQATLRFMVPLTPEELYQIIVEEAIKLVGAKYGSLVLLIQGELKRVYSTMPQEGQFGFRKSGNTMTSLKEKRAFVYDITAHTGVRRQIKDLGLKSGIYIPLIDTLSPRNDAMGVLIINSEKEEQYSQKELEVLKLFGSMASMAIRKIQVYDQMRKALEVRDLFISMAAHELRTPLTTINGYIQLLQHKIPQNGSAESRWVYELYRESNRLTELVHELLEVNRIRTGQLNYNFREHNLHTIIMRALRNFSVTHSSRNIVFENQLTDSNQDLIIGDFDKLLQVLTNLVDNAAKFSPANTPIIIRLRQSGVNLVLQVIDQGAGIPKKDLPFVFKDFYRGTNHTREGIGLGLFLIKNIVDQHNGNIKIRSKLGQGTTIQISLPKA